MVNGRGGAAAAAFCLGFMSLISACSNLKVARTGHARPANRPADVALYSAAPPLFEQIAVLAGTRTRYFVPGDEHTSDALVAQLKRAAARLGANGLILDELAQTQTGSIGSGAGTDSYSAHGSITLGLGATFGIYEMTAKARAIYVAPAAP